MQTLTMQQAVGEIVQTVRSRRQSPGRALDPFFLIVGSGISSPPLPTATEMEAGFRGKLEQDGVPCPVLPPQPAARYARLFETAYPQAEDRRHFLEGLLRGKALSAANLRLAHFLGGRDHEGRPHLTHLVVTPNFDDQLSRALRLFGYDAEVIDNPATVDFLDRERTRDVQIVHVHGTYRHYDCRNLLPEIRTNARSRGGMRKFLTQLLDSHRSPIVLGYSGWEGDVIMSALKEHLQRRKKAGLPHKIYFFCYRRESLDTLPYWLRNDRNVAFALPEEPVQSSDNAGSLAKSFQERGLTLPAHRVIGALIHALGVDPPRLASDPLGFLADQLRLALDLSFSEAEPALYNLERVLKRVEHGKNLEAERWTVTEKRLQAFWDAVQRGDDESTVKAAESLVDVDLDVAERGRVIEQLLAIHVSLRSSEARPELGLQACETSLSLLPQPDRTIAQDVWALGQARALLGRGSWLDRLGRTEEALSSYAELVKRFSDNPAVELQEQVAKALHNRGVALGHRGRADEALANFDEVLKRSGGDSASIPREVVARALRGRGLALAMLNRRGEALDSFVELVRRFGDGSGSVLRDEVASAMINQGFTLGQLGRLEEALDSYADVVKRFGDDPAPGLREQVASATVNQGVTLGQLGRAEEALASYAEVLQRFGEDSTPALREQVARTMFNQGVTLGQLGRLEESLASYTELVRRFGDDGTPTLREQVAVAMFNQGSLLGRLGRAKERLASHTEVVKRFGDDPAPGVQEAVELARRALGPTPSPDSH